MVLSATPALLTACITSVASLPAKECHPVMPWWSFCGQGIRSHWCPLHFDPLLLHGNGHARETAINLLRMTAKANRPLD
eukprot:587928-Amphidinium_carterae.2